MSYDQIFLAIILGATLVGFVGGWIRYDIVAVSALLAVVLTGIVPASGAFSGFASPTVVTVIAVLIMSHGLKMSGVVDIIARKIVPTTGNSSLNILLLGGFAAVLSAFMNNVGALGLLLPVAIQASSKGGTSPSAVLMPLAFASMLGGLMTLIGTPPNIIVSSYREVALGTPYGMFDFAWVGVPLAIMGLAYVSALGWHLIPRSRRTAKKTRELFAVENYITEVQVREGSKAVGLSVRELTDESETHGAELVGLIRDDHWVDEMYWPGRVREGDILTMKASPEGISAATKEMGLELVGEKEKIAEVRKIKAEETQAIEAVVPPNAIVAGLTAETLRLRTRFGVNLLAVSRRGVPFRTRLRSISLEPGDILLLQGSADRLAFAQASLGWLPLAERTIPIVKTGIPLRGLAIFAATIVASIAGLAPTPIAFTAGAVAMVLLRVIPLRDLYNSVEWPIVILLGALIPVGAALETTGATGAIADLLTRLSAETSPVVALVVLLIATMTLSDLMNNAATAVVMAPIGLALAARLGVNPDPFLMAVAVGASCAFLTPIGHQNNVLVMGPGGYHFADYWRVGLPLEILIVAIAVPTLLWAWPM